MAGHPCAILNARQVLYRTGLDAGCSTDWMRNGSTGTDHCGQALIGSMGDPTGPQSEVIIRHILVV